MRIKFFDETREVDGDLQLDEQQFIALKDCMTDLQETFDEHGEEALELANIVVAFPIASEFISSGNPEDGTVRFAVKMCKSIPDGDLFAGAVEAGRALEATHGDPIVGIAYIPEGFEEQDDGGTAWVLTEE